jgi:hypothetical protein
MANALRLLAETFQKFAKSFCKVGKWLGNLKNRHAIFGVSPFATRTYDESCETFLLPEKRSGDHDGTVGKLAQKGFIFSE